MYVPNKPAIMMKIDNRTVVNDSNEMTNVITIPTLESVNQS